MAAWIRGRVTTSRSQRSPILSRVHTALLYGCQPSSFWSEATEDDNNCEEAVTGCTNSAADNYQELATIDDAPVLSRVVWTRPPATTTPRRRFNPSMLAHTRMVAALQRFCATTRLRQTMASKHRWHRRRRSRAATAAASTPRHSTMHRAPTLTMAPARMLCLAAPTLTLRITCRPPTWTTALACVVGVDPLYPNYDSRATYNDNSCEMGGGAGCTDSLASNYNSQASIDNGGCVYSSGIIYGCTDPLAENYNSFARSHVSRRLPVRWLYRSASRSTTMRAPAFQMALASRHNGLPRLSGCDLRCKCECPMPSWRQWMHTVFV